MNRNVPITAGVYSLIRVVLGIYLFIHFIMLLPYVKELFSAEGMFSAGLSPLMGYIPNPLSFADTPGVVIAMIIAGVFASLAVSIGWFDRIAALYLILLLSWLFMRNPLIANPSLPVVGWLLLMHIMLPRGNYGTMDAKSSVHTWNSWHFPKQIWFAAWVLLSVAYTYSGYTKIFSPSWMDGSAIETVLHNPLARDHFFNTMMHAIPSVILQMLTWTVMFVELLFLFFALWEPTRKIVWFVMLVAQFGFLITFDFADLTFPMILFHLLTFDRNWLSKYQPKSTGTLYFDGTCGFCNALVRFGLVEDVEKLNYYAPLYGETYEIQKVQGIESESVIYVTGGQTFYKSDAVVRFLESLGGIWLVFGKLIIILPKQVRDLGYDLFAKVRYLIAGKNSKESCQLLPKTFQSRMLP